MVPCSGDAGETKKVIRKRPLLLQRRGPVHDDFERRAPALFDGLGKQESPVLGDVIKIGFGRQARVEQRLRHAWREPALAFCYVTAIIFPSAAMKNSSLPSRLQMGWLPPFVETCHFLAGVGKLRM